jgi:hypothetical protein
MLKLVIIACCLAIPSAAFAAEPHPSMKKIAWSKICVSPRTNPCVVGSFSTCCLAEQACISVADRPGCFPDRH